MLFKVTSIRLQFKKGLNTLNLLSLTGYKVYWRDGCQIRAPLDKHIADSIEQNLEPWVDYGKLLLQRKNDELGNPDITKQMADSYYKAIKTSGLITGQANIPFDSAVKRPNIAYTAMHGVGHPWAVRSFETFGFSPFYAVPEQKDADPEFPTVSFPNPEEKGALNLAMKFATENDCDIILANDPDADRLAVAERCRESGTWTTFTGDEIGTMLGHWLWESLGKKSDKVRILLCL